jgi:DNA-directed RNA polymerase subunit RPC12/RpoP
MTYCTCGLTGGCAHCKTTEVSSPYIKPVNYNAFMGHVETTNYIRCMKCGKVVSSAPIPSNIIIRAFIECPECVEKESK